MNSQEIDNLAQEYESLKKRMTYLLGLYNDKKATESTRLKFKLKGEIEDTRKRAELVKEALTKLREQNRDYHLNNFQPLDQNMLDSWLSILD